MSKIDFIPSGNVPPYPTDQTIAGALPPQDVNGIPVLGSYGHKWLLQSYLIPLGYVAVVASSGTNSESNPFALRQHESPAWQGLLVMPGPFEKYPLQEASSTVQSARAHAIAVPLPWYKSRRRAATTSPPSSCRRLRWPMHTNGIGAFATKAGRASTATARAWCRVAASSHNPTRAVFTRASARR